jgi:hypothetical protein
LIVPSSLAGDIVLCGVRSAVAAKSLWGLTNEIAILEVEAVQFIAGLLGIHHVLIDDKRRPLCVVGDTLTYLATFSQHFSPHAEL